MAISDKGKSILLIVAREAINSLFDNEVQISEIDFDYYPELAQRNLGAFVTLNYNKQLRGCIGYLASEDMLFDTIVEAAKQAAANDPRFLPVTEDELSNIDIEISVLSGPVSIKSYDEIRIGEHGLILDNPPYHGVLLPQVAIEHEFNVSQFLSALCEKSGLPGNTWMDEQLNIKVFTAQVFSEIDKRNVTYERS